VRDGTARAGRRRSTRDDIRGALATLRRVSADEIESLAIGAWILGIGGGSSSGFRFPTGASSTTMRPVSGGSGREGELLVLGIMRSPFREIASRPRLPCCGSVRSGVLRSRPGYATSISMTSGGAQQRLHGTDRGGARRLRGGRRWRATESIFRVPQPGRQRKGGVTLTR
jgi:hypothetical protein